MIRSRNTIAIPPGATIREQLIDRGMNQKEFAIRMDLSEKHVSKLIHGDVQLTPEVSCRLETVLGIPASFWNNLESCYREAIVKANAENAMEEDEEIGKRFPYHEMSKLGWVPATKNPKERVKNLRQYFGVVKLSVLGNDQIMNTACRRLNITDQADSALMAWIQQVKILSRSKDISQIDIRKLSSSIEKIRELTLLEPQEFISKLEILLSDCGISLIILPHLRGSFLQSAAFSDGNRIVIGMTARGKDADIFWFSLFHELAHIVLGHLDKGYSTTDQDEKAADVWAADKLINPREFEAFQNRHSFSEKSILDFAQSQGISAGIVVGRLQKEGLVKHSALNHLKEKMDLPASQITLPDPITAEPSGCRGES